MSKRVKIEGIKGEPIDMSNWYANRKKQELAEQERKRKEKEQEEERINKIECPLCKSTDKIQRIKRKSNGIMGPGHSILLIRSSSSSLSFRFLSCSASSCFFRFSYQLDISIGSPLIPSILTLLLIFQM